MHMEISDVSDDSVMQPTEAAWPPAWYSLYRRRRLQHEPAPAPAPARRALYHNIFNSKNSRNLHVIRVEDMLDNIVQLPTSFDDELKVWRRPFAKEDIVWRAHISPEVSKLHRKKVIDYQQRLPNYAPMGVALPPGSSSHALGARAGAGGGAGAGAWGARSAPGAHSASSGGSAWGGWAAGVVLLGLLVLVVKAAEKCLDKRLFKPARRRQSEEWPTPSVMATSLQQQNIAGGSLPHLDDLEFSSPGQRNSDLPPPYSECALKHNANIYNNFSNLSSEEAPPPYSDCLVAFSNKDIPTVDIHRRRMNDEPQTSSEIDNVQNDLRETRHRVDVDENNYDESTMRVELVFDNGRIVERTIDIDSTDNVPEIVANVGETVIGNSIDDNVPEIVANVGETVIGNSIDDNVPEIVANVGETVIGNSIDDNVAENISHDRVIFV